MALLGLGLVRHELTDGYSMQSATGIAVLEAAELQIAAGGLPKDDKHLYIGVRDVLADRGVVAHDVQVRDDDTNTLVGVGTLWQHGANGELSDLAVLPEHRGRGIGKAIIDERLLLARDREIGSLMISYLLSTNTLATYYERIGFRRIGPYAYGAGRAPKRVAY